MGEQTDDVSAIGIHEGFIESIDENDNSEFGPRG